MIVIWTRDFILGVPFITGPQNKGESIGEELIAYEITIYTSCCNATKGIYYYTTYDNHQITAVDIHEENLDSDKLISYKLIDNGEVRMQNKK